MSVSRLLVSSSVARKNLVPIRKLLRIGSQVIEMSVVQTAQEIRYIISSLRYEKRSHEKYEMSYQYIILRLHREIRSLLRMQ
jgi:hypothetical protein